MFVLTWILNWGEIWSSEHAEIINVYPKSLVKTVLPVNVNSHKGFMLFLKLGTLMRAVYIVKDYFTRNNVCMHLPRLESKLGKPSNLLQLQTHM